MFKINEAPPSELKFRGPRKVADFLGRGETYEAVISKSYCILLRLQNVFDEAGTRVSIYKFYIITKLS